MSPEGTSGTALRGALTDVMPSLAALLGVPRMPDRLGLGTSAVAGARRVVVLLVDGLGWRALCDHAQLAPTLTRGVVLGPLASTLPSTTAAAITSFGTGLPVGQHGILASAFEVDGEPLWPLSWQSQPNPVATQPEQTVLERASSAGVSVCSVAPAKFRDSGLTRAALRGGRFRGAEDTVLRVDAAAAELAAARATGAPALVYVYWPDLDKAGHVHGVASPQWREELGIADRLAAGLVALLGPGEALLVTADHGMLDVPDDRRVDLDALPALGRGVRRVLGEPRLRHVYAEPGHAGGVARRWRAELGGSAHVVTRDEAAERWFAPTDPWYLDRIGDVVAMAADGLSLVSDRADRIVSHLRGQHGAATADEVEVPLLAWLGAT